METKATVVCSIRGCNNRQKPMFHFPNPKINLYRFDQWVRAANNPRFSELTTNDIYRRGFVCGKHFKEDDHVPGSRRLAKHAVPTLHLPVSPPLCPREAQLAVIDLPETEPSTSEMTLKFETPPKERHTFKFPSPRKRVTPSPWSPSKRGSIGDRSSIRSRKSIGFSPSKCEADAPTSLGVAPLDEELFHEPAQTSQQHVTSVSETMPTTSTTPSTLSLTPKKVLKDTNEEKKTLAKRLRIQKKTSMFSHTEQVLYKEAQRLQQRLRRLRNTHNFYKENVKAASRLSREQQLKNVMEDMSPIQKRFFESQLRNVSRKPKGRSFTFENKADAIAIWRNGPKTYKLLSKMFALPSVTTLKATLNSVPLKPGISKPIFEVLKRQVGRMRNQKHKYCVLLYDEVAVQPHLDYLPHEDRVIGFVDDGSNQTRELADHVGVFMLRGIFKRWKQPVAFAFCKSSMQPPNIVRFYKEIVRKATAAGLNVIASICDQGTTNVKAIDMLLSETRRQAALKGEVVKDGVIMVDDHQVIPLFDPPHLLKSMRNNLLTKDLSFVKDGKRMVAKWSHIVDAYLLDQGRPVRSMKKLSKYHVLPNKIRKMKVSLCSQVFSHTVASFIDLAAGATLERTGGRSLPSEAYETSVLIKFLDNVFDSVNGGIGHASGKVLRGLVTRKSPHESVWLKAKIMFSEMEFVKSKPGDRSRPPVLDGWCRTLNGFILIKETLQRLGCNSFPARAFNQDPLENFFGQVRQYGVRYTNPTCKMFIPFFKALLIRNFTSYHSSGSNCERDDDSMLVTIRDYLSQKHVAQQEQPDRWKPPPVNDTEIDYFDANALGYVSGFVLKHIAGEKYDCDICIRNLEHVGEPNQFYHELVRLREYNEDEKRRLRYLNVDVIRVFIKLYNYLNILVPSALYHRQFSERLISHLRSLIHFQFEECPHSETIKSQLFRIFVKVYIFGYMKRLSNIVLGKQEPRADNDLETQLHELSTRFKSK